MSIGPPMTPGARSLYGHWGGMEPGKAWEVRPW